MFKLRKLSAIISLAMVAISCSQLYAYEAPSWCNNLYNPKFNKKINMDIFRDTPTFAEIMDNAEPEWVEYDRPKSAGKAKKSSRYEVCVNTQNILANMPIHRKRGIVFAVRDILKSVRTFAEACGDHYERAHGCNIDPPRSTSKRECRESKLWFDYNRIPCVIGYYIVVYKYHDASHDEYRTWCYKSEMYNSQGKIIMTQQDDMSSALWEDRLEYLPVLQKAIDMYCEVNGYKDLDDLFRVKLGQ